MELKAFNIIQKEYKDDENFFLTCEAFIGPEGIEYVYEVYSIYVISLKRLNASLIDEEIMLNKGWMIQKKYDESKVKEKIKSIINICTEKDEQKTYSNLAAYFFMQDC